MYAATIKLFFNCIQRNLLLPWTSGKHLLLLTSFRVPDLDLFIQMASVWWPFFNILLLYVIIPILSTLFFDNLMILSYLFCLFMLISSIVVLIVCIIHTSSNLMCLLYNIILPIQIYICDFYLIHTCICFRFLSEGLKNSIKIKLTFPLCSARLLEKSKAMTGRST